MMALAMDQERQAADGGLGPLAGFHDYGAGEDDFEGAVVQGLGLEQKRIPAKYFYDARGSALFDEICELEEYYPTRTELDLLRTHAPEVADLAGPGIGLVEFGSGSSVKVRLLLDALRDPAVYVPVEISRTHLLQSAGELARDYPDLAVVPVCADYTRHFELPPLSAMRPRLGFFPGSTIGNFTRIEAAAFLGRAAVVLGPGAGLLIGADLEKDAALLHDAYNDAKGVTAAFNLNLLARINRELGGDFDPEAFRHHAPWNPARGCVEMHLVSTRRQTVTVAGRRFEFAEGESIHTEDSHKYSIPAFQEIARAGGWRPVRVWTDPRNLFSLHYLVAG